jgi:DNA polymerase-3 subunit epsilon
MTPAPNTCDVPRTWLHGPIASFDLETTGVDPMGARIVTACLVVEGRSPQEWLLDPGVQIPPAAEAVHGISTEQARRHGRGAAECVGEIRDALHEVWARDLPLVVFNAPYDLTLLSCELARHGQGPLVVGAVLDPLVLWRELERYRKGKKRLGDACERFAVDPGRAHCSTSDAQAALGVLRAMAEEFGLCSVTLQRLGEQQAQWHERWARSFSEWLVKQGGDATGVDTRWPLAC